MKLRDHILITAGLGILVATLGQTTLCASPLSEAVVEVADRLAARQDRFGGDKGSWPKEEDLTGFIVAGMVGAYEDIWDGSYSYSAQLGGEFIYNYAGATYWAPEAYAFTRLSDLSGDPNNVWRLELESFFAYAKDQPGGTIEYLNTFFYDPAYAGYFDIGDVTTLIAFYAMAADYVDAEDKVLVRNYLMRLLADVTDATADSPVQALGAATWALASTGAMDDSVLDPHSLGAARWYGVTLADLPDILMDQQVPTGDPNAGSFYSRFDHTDGRFDDGVVDGYTTVAAYGTLGLLACRNERPDVEPAIMAGRQALLRGIDSFGRVADHLWENSEHLHGLGGLMLMVLSELITPADLDLDGDVDAGDYALFMNNWQSAGCTSPDWCVGADINHDTVVDFEDLKVFASDYWLFGAGN